MKLEIFAVRDCKSGTYGSPMFVPTRGVIIRSLSDQLNRPNPPIEDVLANHPEDFELFDLGSWDTDSAVFSLHPAPVSVLPCSNLRIKGNGHGDDRS